MTQDESKDLKRYQFEQRKRRTGWILPVLLATALISGCQAKVKAAPQLTIFAAASLTESLTAIGRMYETEYGVKLIFNFDSSGTLKTQIEEGAASDVFLSAGQNQLDGLDLAADPAVNPRRLDLLAPGTRVDLLENKVVLAVPDHNPGGLTDFADMAAKLTDGTLFMALGNADVPVGQYSTMILKYYGFSVEELSQAGHLTFGSNVKEVTAQVKEGTVDCGIIYSTDAKAAGLRVIDQATKEMVGQVIYPAAVLKNAADPEEAKRFLDYLRGEPARAVFREAGFSPLQ